MTIPSVIVAVESAALRREFVTKSGSVVAVQNFNASIPVGSVFGLLGENGAGKTTLVRMFAGLLRPTSGSLIVLGHDAVADGSDIRRRVSLMLGGERGFFDRLSGWDNLPRTRRDQRLVRSVRSLGRLRARRHIATQASGCTSSGRRASTANDSFRRLPTIHVVAPNPPANSTVHSP